MKPRPVFPGATKLITRSCLGRHFFLRPCPAVNQVFLYCLAVAAAKYGILVHSFVIMSNHWHVVVTDPRGMEPYFTRDVHRNVAKCLNRHWGRSDYFWDSQAPSSVWLLDEEAIVEKMVYVMSNPVAAALVAHQKSWPGLITKPAQTKGATLGAKRPAYFQADGTMPEEATLTITRPPAWLHLSDEAFSDCVRPRCQ